MFCPRCAAHTVPLDDGRPFCPACLWEGKAEEDSFEASGNEEAGLPSVEERVQAWIERTIEDGE